ncbi:MAG: Succinoglycan biosynthesis transport protein [Candidatus Scalindua rubra]|uniref:non-specific protein-tyrosine kinase n=1 Tax=Candidatus Scalindua rubra TaxID=1872076 RepID=A0A1E3X4X0_9BACT|nr:MAG: Succinoglycan biosynthesis transport protein [Candidatus Scalindua rubra]
MLNNKEQTHLTDYIKIIQKRQWVVILVFVVLVATVTISTIRMTPVYQAKARVLIEKEERVNVTGKDIQEVVTYDPYATRGEFYKNQHEILKSRSLAKRVIEELKLGNGPELPSGSSKRRLIDVYLKKLSITPVRNTGVVNVSFSGNYPDIITDILNAHVKFYKDQELERRFLASQDAVEWIDGRLKDLGKDLEKDEEELQKYKEDEDLITLDNLGTVEQRQNIVLEKLSELSTELTRAKTQRIGVETLYNEIQKLSERPEMIEAITPVIENRLIQDLKADYARLEAQVSNLSEKYGPRHPQMVRLLTQMEAIKDKIDFEVKKIISSIETKYKVARAKEDSIRESLEKQKEEALRLNKKAIKYGILKREADTNKDLYEILLTRLKEASMTGALKTSNIRILDAAVVPRHPIKPRVKLNIILAIIVGLTLGVGLAFFLDYLDRTLSTPEDVERYLQVPLLGAVGRIEMDKQKRRSEQPTPASGLGGIADDNVFVPELFVHRKSKSNIAEAIRNIRTNIIFTATDTPRKLIMIASANPDEGKTFFVSNLATVIAHTGKKVLMVDTDMRKPRLNKIFSVERNPGVSNVLAGEASIESCIKDTEISNLNLITSGSVPPNPSEMLGSASMEKFCDDIRKMFDYVLLDSPPIMSVTDATILARLTDASLLLVKTGETNRDAVKRSIAQFNDINAKVLGVVMNNVDLSKGSYYYHYYQYYYRYGYGEEEEKKGRKKRRSKG